MIEDSEYDAKRALTEFLNNLVPVANMFVIPDIVLLLVGVESVVCLRVFGYLTVGYTKWQVIISSILHSLIYIEEVDHVVFKNLALLVLPQVWRKHTHRIIPRHWELDGVRSHTLPMSLLVCGKLR